MQNIITAFNLGFFGFNCLCVKYSLFISSHSKYPKTDWTYSPHSKDRVEIAPGVVAMPNMSRRTIHSYDGSSSSVSDLIQSESYLSEAVTGSNKVVTADEIDYNITDIKPQQLFAINNNTVDGNNSYSSYSSSYNIKRVQEKSSVRNVVSRFFISIYMLITNWIYYVYETHNYGLVWCGKKLHRFVSWVMLMDTWLMRKQEYGRCRNNKTKNVLLLCLLPLLLFGGEFYLFNYIIIIRYIVSIILFVCDIISGLHLLLASGVSLAPSCHPHCQRIASTYFNSFINAIYNIFGK